MNAKFVTIAALLAALVALSFSWKPWQASQKLRREIASRRAELQAMDTTLQEQAALLDRLREEQDARKRNQPPRIAKSRPGIRQMPRPTRRMEKRNSFAGVLRIPR